MVSAVAEMSESSAGMEVREESEGRANDVT